MKSRLLSFISAMSLLAALGVSASAQQSKPTITTFNAPGAGAGPNEATPYVATCSGGSIASGVYSNLRIAGNCNIDAGSVTVEHDLRVLPGGVLVGVTGGFDAVPASSDLTVGGNLDVQPGGLLNLGCEPIHDICVNDPDQKVGTYSTHDTIAGNLTADSALALVVHYTAIGGNVVVSGGGGGINSCHKPIPGFGPPFGDFEDDVVEGTLTIARWRSCYLAMIRDTVTRNVNFNNNVTGDPDGNEVVNNTVVGNLNCSGNDPAPQIGDSMGGPSTVLGKVNGQCTKIAGGVVR